ncbi:tyrosine-protein phosphatase [Actinocorallia sp. B10E7]|uniref:tyrosine-protein phosphatase n=1 Tax=Actinocorallia sp. B10E7 TaxID=3153558 RepID=UPI00325D5512
MEQTRWISLEGAVNVRDLGGLPTTDGRATRFGRVLRSDNLQGLTASDVALLSEELGVGHVIDLRSLAEVQREGPGPLTRLPGMTIHHLSLFVETQIAAGVEVDKALPWQSRTVQEDPEHKSVGFYHGYLRDRADSIVSALRVMAHEEGASIVHCAAGKDRTGVVSALALEVAGVAREAIIADYALTAERLDAILHRLLSSETYHADLRDRPTDSHLPHAFIMERFLHGLDRLHGGVLNWLAANGWNDDDTGALRSRLVR